MATDIITYEAFGAKGDGINDDLPAICQAHEEANKTGQKVVARPDACYHLGRRALTANIETDTDWNTARFIIDDTDLEDHKEWLFNVRSGIEHTTLPIKKLHRDQRQLDIKVDQSTFILVENDQHNVYIRRGLNQNAGFPQSDCFILHPDGSIEGDIDWDYDHISNVRAKPIPEKTLSISGGIFTTYANRMRQETGYNYHSRGITIGRSNTVIDSVTHYVVGETEYGHPYRGFLDASKCANVTYQNCFATGHKIYSTIGSAGEPVNMGSYDLHANNIVNFSLINCRMNHIKDRTRWGVIGSNFCKNILLDGCELSRMDTHMGVSGTYIIRNCTLGHMGLNAIGRGTLKIENTTTYGPTLASFRGDYGSTWEGDVEVTNVRWIPSCGEETKPRLFATHNDGTHDFGYPCFMPKSVVINGLDIDDSNTPDDYTGPVVFTDPDNPDVSDQPFPYQRCESVTLKNVNTESGKSIQVSQNQALNECIQLS